MKSVSRVINREPNVSEKLRAKVQTAIDKLGYAPDMAARSLAGARAFAIGILFDNPSPHYTMKVQGGAYQACRDHGYHLSIENIDSAAADADAQMRDILQNSRVDGFVLTPPITECAAIMDVLEAQGIPYTRIAPISFPGRSPAVRIEDGAAAAVIARHLWSLGHRRFGIVTGPAEHGAAVSRRAGFLEMLSTLGNMIEVMEAYGGFHFDGGIEAGRILLDRRRPPTAIFAANDDSAVGVMSAAAQLGMRVPQDVAVAGFDDSWIAKSVWPYLTTIRQPIHEMAYEAASLLIRGPGTDEGVCDHVLDYDLIVRDSTGAKV